MGWLTNRLIDSPTNWLITGTEDWTARVRLIVQSRKSTQSDCMRLTRVQLVKVLLITTNPTHLTWIAWDCTQFQNSITSLNMRSTHKFQNQMTSWVESQSFIPLSFDLYFDPCVRDCVLMNTRVKDADNATSPERSLIQWDSQSTEHYLGQHIWHQGLFYIWVNYLNISVLFWYSSDWCMHTRRMNSQLRRRCWVRFKHRQQEQASEEVDHTIEDAAAAEAALFDDEEAEFSNEVWGCVDEF